MTLLLRFWWVEILLFNLLTASAQVTVPYLLNDPVIDGCADKFLQAFSLNSFSSIVKSNKNNPDIKAGYYLAYTARYLYLFIEAEAGSLVIRDRAYQNGDGFHMMIGKPQKENTPTDEFYVLAFSPEKSWCHKMIWYYNTELIMTPLADETKFEISAGNGKISFELLLPWREVYPYNPLFSETGFNLCFVKAFENNEGRNYYFVKEDDKLQSEQSERKYKVLNFEIPPLAKPVFASVLIKNTISENENPAIRIAAISGADTKQNITVKFLSGEDSTVFYRIMELQFPKGLSTKILNLRTIFLTPGDFKIKIYSADTVIGEHSLAVLPETTTRNLKNSLLTLKSSVNEGTFNTLMFYINEIDSTLKRLKDYECAHGVRNKITEVEHYLRKLIEGTDLLQNKKGYYRRAYLSAKDGLLYPYSVYIPCNYSNDTRYPLLVYLHGSGDDDRILSRCPLIPDGFIVLAPNGRGTSNCFTGSGPQTDIEESVADVIRNFNIDTSNIILCGFSMGGYGVFRTFYEHPEMYKAIASFSGHPDLARKWLGPDEINFLDKKNLDRFKNIPVFIYHGTNDMNCPFSLTEQFVKKLEKNKCIVTFETTGGGHGEIPLEIRQKFFGWLMNLTYKI